VPNPGIPESFRVMLKELQSLGLDVVVQDKEGNAVDMRQRNMTMTMPTLTTSIS